MNPADRLASRPDEFSQTLTRPSRSDPGRFCAIRLVDDIFPSTTAVFSYAIGSRKLLANEQDFVDVQTVVIFLQTTQIISDVCFITDHVAYASSNKTEIV